MNSPLISIIIPVKNAAPWLENQLNALSRQTLAAQTELIYIDSSSTDQTAAILQQHNVLLISIKPETFNHGDTRNLGVQHAKGKFVVMTVQDAWPATDDWLERLLEGFDDDAVLAVCGRQITPADPDKNPIQWFKENPTHISKFRREQYTKEEYEQLSPDKKRFAANLDNVNTMYRRTALLKRPFTNITFGEDVVWGKEAIESGSVLMYSNHARVFHYHHEDYKFTFKRLVAVAFLMYQQFGIIPDEKKLGNNPKRTLWFMRELVLENRIHWKDKFRWLKYNVAQRKALHDAALAFNKALDAGNEEFLSFYNQYCSTSPLAKHRNQK